MSHDFQKLVIWKRSLELTIILYQLTKKFPKEEVFGITNQLRRAMSSVPANIAEGSARSTNKDFSHFIGIAHGSINEVITFIILAEKLNYIEKEMFLKIMKELEEISNMLAVFSQKLRS